MPPISVGQVAQVLLLTTSSLELNAQQGVPWSLLDKLQTDSQHLDTWDPHTLLAAESIWAAKELDQFMSFPEEVQGAENVLATPPQ